MSDQAPSLPETNEIRAAVQKRLHEERRGRVLGAQLGQLINEVLGSGYSYKALVPVGQPPTLRQFCATYLIGVVHPTEEFSGPDQWYRVEGVESVKSSGPVGSIWKAFVSLSPKHSVVLSREHGELLALPLGSTVPPSGKTIESLSLAEHKNICEGFCEKLAGSGKNVAGLRRVLESYHNNSYPDWLDVVRSYMPRVDGEWAVFRRTEIVKLFRQRLITLGIGADDIERLVPQLYTDQARASQAQNAVVQRMRAPVVAQPQADGDARKLLHAIVDRMDLAQLRGLQVPFGAVLDVIGHRSDR